MNAAAPDAKTETPAVQAACVSINHCRSCGSGDLVNILSLGEMPLANTFVKSCCEAGALSRFPLNLSRCNGCGLVQIRETVHSDLLFREYAYFSSASAPLARHFEETAGRLREWCRLQPDDLVLDIGANDGVFLRHLMSSARVVGCDPADNVTQQARELGIPILPMFFDEIAAGRILDEYGKARLIFASNVLGHVDDLDGFMRGVSSVLTAGGVFVAEVHHLQDLLDRNCFDQIYHEHRSYFSLASLEHLMNRHGLAVVHAETSLIHGSLLQVRAMRTEDAGAASAGLMRLRQAEDAAALSEPGTYLAFADRVETARRELREWVRHQREEGRRIAGYGACAKANILLNSCGFNSSDIAYIVDSTPFKQGRFTPGAGIPVVARSELKRNPPDWIILLAWNYSRHILEQETALRQQGVRFLLPIPRPIEI